MAGRDIKTIIPANSQITISASGSFVFLKSSSSNLRVDIASKQVDMVAGDKLVEQGEFDGFTAHNDTGAAITAVFVVGYGDFVQGSVTGIVTVTRPTNFDGVADAALGPVGVTQILGADVDRVLANITNLSGNVSTIRVGGAGSVGAAIGTPLAPGQTLTVNGSADISAYSPDAGVIYVGVSVEKN